MKRFLLFFVMVLLSFFATAQKKVAVMEVKADKSVSSMQALMIRGSLETAVGNTEGYDVYDRTNFETIMQELNFQRSGAVNDNEIKRLGEMAGVQYIVVPEAIAEEGNIYILVKMLDVETGKYGGVREKFCKASSQEIHKACAELGKELFVSTTPVKKTVVAAIPEKTTTTKTTEPKKTVDPVAPKTPVNPVAPKKTITTQKIGEFTVADGKKVKFAKGNLQYQASTNTWRFAEHQWDMVGVDNKNISKKYNGWIDLFGWGTGDKPIKTSKNKKDYSVFNDWGNNTISNGGTAKWRTMTSAEWNYVFNKRNTTSGVRYAKAIVNDVNGMILLPDNWDSSKYALADVNMANSIYKSNVILKQDWEELFETAGAVFLPAAGNRGYRDENFPEAVGASGYYWSSTLSSTSPLCFEFGYYFRLPSFWGGIEHYGMSVRLVYDVK